MTSEWFAMSSLMVLTNALLFLFDLVLLVLVLFLFVEKRKVRKEVSRLVDSESSVLELSESMERLIEEYRRVASKIQDDTSAKRDELMRTIQRADRLLMELVRRSDRFELAVESHEASRQTANQPVKSTAAQPRTGTERAGVQRQPARPITSVKPLEAKRASTKVSSGLAGRKVGLRGVRPFVAPADVREESASPTDEDEDMEKTKRLVIDLAKQGLSIETIAKSLRVPIGQVKLILDVHKSKKP